MEQNNFSYAKRKVIAMPTILIITIVIFIFVILTQQVSAAGYVWGQTYIYDNIDDSYLNQSLWTNNTECGGLCNDGAFPYSNDYPSVYILEDTSSITGTLNGYHNLNPGNPAVSAQLTSIALPSLVNINNVTLSAYLGIAHSATGGIGTNEATLNIFSNIIKSLYCTGGTVCAQADSSVWTIRRNETTGSNMFDVFNDDVYTQTITASNNILYLNGYASMTPNNVASSSSFILYYVNYTLSNNSMSISLTNPINNYFHYSSPSSNITFNATAQVTLNTLKNITFYTDYVARYSEDITGTSNASSYSNNFTVGQHSWRVLVCDSADNCKFSDTYLFTESNFVTVSTNYSATAYETESQTFNVTVTYDTVAYPNAYAYIVYNGVSDTVNSVKTIGGINTMFSSTIDIPASTGVKDFYFIIYFDPANPTNYQLTTINNQTVSAINFSNCTGGTTYINMSYLNEISLNPVNLSVQTSTWTYWLGGGSVTKSYFFNTADLNTTHSFCFTPASKTVYTGINYQYGVEGIFPIRTFQTSTLTPQYLTLTNSTLFQPLYTIAAAESASITFQVSDASSANIIQNARLTITKSINGNDVQIFDGYTDGSGLVNVWLSTSTSYTVTSSKAGCGSVTRTITPVSSYNIQLNCAGNMTKFVSQIDGVTYQRYPADGATTYSGTINYQYKVSSLLNPIRSAKFQLIDESGNIIAINETNATTGSSFCTNSSCLLSLVYTTACGDNIKGRYYVNLGNTTNYTYVLLEGDALWRFICINTTNSQQSFTKIVDNFNQFMFQWSAGGQVGTSCRIYKTQSTCNAVVYCKWLNYTGYQAPSIELCTLKDDYNKAEFNRVLIIFFGMVIVLFIIGKSTGYEMSNPGSFVMFMTGAIIIMSFAGMFRFSGATLWPFFDQWIYAFICTLLSVGYNFSIVRRYSA